MSYLKDINRLYAEGNLGSVVDIKVARKADLATVADPVMGSVPIAPIFHSGKYWVTWKVIMESPSAKGSPQIGRHGPFKKNTIDFTIPKDQPGIRAMLDLAQQDELIALYKDGNGQLKVAGLLHMPMRFQYNHTTGSQFDNLNGYSCQFYYDGPDNVFNAKFILGTLDGDTMDSYTLDTTDTP